VVDSARSCSEVRLFLPLASIDVDLHRDPQPLQRLPERAVAHAKRARGGGDLSTGLGERALAAVPGDAVEIGGEVPDVRQMSAGTSRRERRRSAALLLPSRCAPRERRKLSRRRGPAST